MQGENADTLTNFAFRLQSRAERQGLSQSEIAGRLGTSTSRVNHWFTGRNFPRVRERADLAKMLACNLDWLVKGEGEIEKNLQALMEDSAPYGAGETAVREVPVISWSHAGAAATYEEMPKHFQGAVATTSRNRKAFGLTVEGDCMEPKYLPGDVLVLEPGHEPRNGKAVVARFVDDSVVVRIYTKMPGNKIRLASLKPLIYPTLDHSPKEFAWIFPVHSSVRYE